MRFSYVLIAAVGLAFIALGIRAGIDRVQFSSIAGTAQGIISRIREYYKPGHDDLWRDVYVTYTVNGQSYESLSNHSTNGMREGQEITVRYDPSDPSTIRTDTLPTLALFLCGFGVFTLGLLAIAIKATGDGKRRKKRLRINARSLYADIHRVSRDRSLMVSGQTPYVIVVRFAAPDDEETVYELPSEHIWFDPRPILTQYEIKNLPVYFDRKKPMNSDIDISEITKHAGKQ